MTSPSWLAAIAKDAHVQPLAMKMLESYICPCPQGGTLGLAEVVNTLTGKHPRRNVTPLDQTYAFHSQLSAVVVMKF